jgi:hypothetical protein
VRTLLQAPPGFGKSRRLAKAAVEHGGRTLFFVRSHLEALQVYSYIAEYGGSAALMFGRSSLCKFGARTATECLLLRERGICKARYKYINRKFAKIDDIYNAGVCPYEYLQAIGRQSKIAVLPIAYLESQEYLSSIADLLRESDLVIIDEAHNLLLHDLLVEKDIPSDRICDSHARRCVLLPIMGELLKGRDVLLASASVTKPFSEIFVKFLDINYINNDNIFFENLVIDIYPIKIRYINRISKSTVLLIKKILNDTFSVFNKIILFLPNKELYEYYKVKLREYPLSDRPLGDIPHIVITYFGSPLSEGVNVDADAAILVGFPIPNVTDSWLKAKMQIVDRLGLSGFRYVLLFAAVSNSVQAMGRVMRGLENREKYVAAVDDRFWKYRWAMPRWFTNSAVLRETPTR